MDELPWMVGPESTSVDWQKHPRPIAVLPVGSTEQHSSHLPIESDKLEADYFGRFVAEELGAALLPTLPIFQCYEHSGFRGSIGLRPETAMALIRDIVDAVERQHFTRLVIVNYHGGNFALPLVVRDINRQDRSIKVLLVHPYELDNTEIGRKLRAASVHSDGWETSMMLGIAPEKVREFKHLTEEIAIEGATRFDLNHFGIGAIRPGGHWGDPSVASSEAGETIIESIKENVIPWIKQRLKWFDENPFYAGEGPVVLRKMLPDDIGAALRLTRIAGWNQRREDWELLLRICPDRCFVAQHNGKVVGTVTATDYEDNVGWLGMLLVDPELRRRGIGTQLLNEAINSLSSCDTVKLDATPAGKELYDAATG